MDSVIMRIVNALKTENPERIYLFGSRATGTERADSDYDICVLKHFDENLWSKENKRIYIKLRQAVPDVYTDLVLYTPESFEEDKDYHGYVTYDIFRKGIIIYDRTREGFSS